MKIDEVDLTPALGNIAMTILVPIDLLLIIPITILFVQK